MGVLTLVHAETFSRYWIARKIHMARLTCL